MTGMKKKYMMLLLATAVICGCGNRDDDPQFKAARMLGQSRELLAQCKYDAARDTLLSMRVQCPTAVEARAQGILLLDSIELLAAIDSLKEAEGEQWKQLDVKREFFERKLDIDKRKHQSRKQ